MTVNVCLFAATYFASECFQLLTMLRTTHVHCTQWISASVTKEPRVHIVAQQGNRYIVASVKPIVMSDIGHRHIAVIFNIGDERATALRCPMHLICSDWFTTSQWLQLSATRYSPNTSTMCGRDGHKCMEAPLCGERISSGSLETQGNSQLSLLPHKDKDGTTSVRIMKLTLAVTAAVVWLTSLVVPRLETINDSGSGATSRWRRRSSLVVHAHVVGGEANPAVFTLMCVLTPVSRGSSLQPAGTGRVITRADTGGHTQQPLITVGNVTIVEHFVKWSTQALKTMTDSSGLLYHHQYSYYYALTPFTPGILKSLFSWKSIIVCLTSIFLDYCFLTSRWRLLSHTGLLWALKQPWRRVAAERQVYRHTGNADWRDGLRTGHHVAHNSSFTLREMKLCRVVNWPFITHTLIPDGRPCQPPSLPHITSETDLSHSVCHRDCGE